uniref:Uncharacterized protein n=1 Tax=Trichobilharzia regenti TaxID=157069 RepID=A0AA85JHX7_TRIRE|nr:unnamed protein product [Trichobilharzia regenti]
MAKRVSEVDSRTTPEETWHNIQLAVDTVVTAINNPKPEVSKSHWISTTSSELIDSRRQIRMSSDYAEGRKPFKRKLTRSCLNDREQLWATKQKEMEKTTAKGNARQLFRLTRETDGKRRMTSDIVSEKMAL